MRCVIFGALPVERLPFKITDSDYIIACDRGLAVAKALNITPDLIIGDFDSLGCVPEGENVMRLNVRKDDTDVSVAVKTALKKGFKEISVLGALGGAFDHSLANFQIAAFAANRGADTKFYNSDGFLTAITDGKITLPESRSRFSVFAVNDCSGVFIKGAEFPLENADLSPLFPLGVSNAQTGVTEISVKKGTLAVFSYL